MTAFVLQGTFIGMYVVFLILEVVILILNFNTVIVGFVHNDYGKTHL